MSCVLPLSHIACDVCVQILIGRRECVNIDDNELIDSLSTNHYTAVSGSILNRIVDFYPKRLTSTVLAFLGSPHVKSLNLKKCTQVLDAALYEVIKRCNPHHLDLSECRDEFLRDGLFSLCSTYLQNLTSFTADNTDITNEIVHTILTFLPQLKHLGLSSCNEITDEAFLMDEKVQLFQERQQSGSFEMLSSLTSIDVSACQKIGSMGIRNLVTLCGPTLQHLDFSWTKVDCMSFWYLGGYSFNSAVFLTMNLSKIEGHSFEEILGECDNVMKKCTSIGDINKQTAFSTEENAHGNSCYLSDSSNVDRPPVVDNMRQHESPFLPQWSGSDPQSTLNMMMEDVKIAEQNTLPAQDVADVSVKCNSQETLLLEESPQSESNQTSQESSSHSESCHGKTRSRLKWYEPVLLSLNANSIDFSHKNLNVLCLKAFFLSNQTLKKLTLSWKELSDEMLEHIGKSSPKLADISLLNCEKITATGVLSLGNLCKEIEALNFKGVLTADNHRSVIPLITSRTKRIDLSECDVTDPVMTAIAKNCKDRLIHLDLSWCENVTEQGLLEVIKNCPSLKVLILHQCQVTLCVMDSISLNCTALTKLSLFMVPEMNDDTVVMFVERLTLLEDIDLSWNESLTDVSLKAILVRCIHLKQLCITGLKLVTSNPLMPIIGDIQAWNRFKSLLRLKTFERQSLEDDEHYSSSDEEYEYMHLAYRSTSYAVNLRYINFNYCNRINDTQLNEIAYCCAGSLRIVDYYGYEIEPVGFPKD